MRGDLPVTHFLMSAPMVMWSGQAQVYLGECSLIRGAGRHRNSQPPFMLFLSLHQFVPTRVEVSTISIRKTCVHLFLMIFSRCCDVSVPVGCLRSWYSTMSSGWFRSVASLVMSFPVRRLALKTALLLASVQNTFSCWKGKKKYIYLLWQHKWINYEGWLRINTADPDPIEVYSQ